MRCAIYARYSSDNQNDRSIDDQIRKCCQFADREGWQVLDGHIYTDRALSGTTTVGRAGLHQLLELALSKSKPFDYVLIDDTSRLSRDKIEQPQIIRDLKEYGVYIFFVSDNIDTKDDSTEDVLLPVYGIKDSLYTRDLARKTKRGMEGQVLKGFNPGGRTYGFGYVPVPDPSGVIDKKTRQVRSLGTRIKVNEQQAKVVRTIFSMYASGYGLRSIADNLNQQGIEPPGADIQRRRGNDKPTWCPNAIRVMLLNPKYIGDWTWNRHKWIRRRKTGKRVQVLRPQEEWIVYRDEALVIVGRDIWAAVRKKFEENAKRYKTGQRSPRKNYLMSGLLKCGICGSNLIVVRCQSPEKVEYGCSFNWHRGATACPNNIRVKREEVEDRVISAIRSRVLNPDVIHLMVEKVNAKVKQRLSKISSLMRTLLDRKCKLTSEIDNLIEFIASGNGSPKIQEVIRRKEQKLFELEGEMARKATINFDTKLKVDPSEITSWFNDLKDLINSDVVTARVKIGNVIGELTATPVSQHGRTGLMLNGKPKIDGVLGVVGVASTSNGSGEGI